MMLLLVFVLSSVEAAGGLGSSRSCPPPCRCEGDRRLQRVDCVDVGLRDVPSNLSSFTSSLRLAGNNLTEIHKDAFAGLVGLRELMLQNNHLMRVPSEALENLRNLRSLRLDANFISQLPASSFKGLSSLHHLWLDDNVLTEFSGTALSDLTQLQALTLALNNIRNVPEQAFASLRQLVALDLSFNKISSFPAAVRCLTNLRDLNLQNNNIAVIPENAFSGNPSIQTINIWNNPIHAVGHSAFQLLPELRTLFLSGSITSLPDFTGTNRLETLSIRGGHVSFLPSSICEELPNLHTLDLSHNLIQDLPRFIHCGKIQHINGRHDDAQEMNPGTVQQMKEPSSLVADQLFDLQSCVFLHCFKSTSLQENSCSSTCCLDLLHLIICLLFTVSVVLNVLVLVCVFLLSPTPGPLCSRGLLALLFWFRLLAGVSGTCVLAVDCLCGSAPQPDPGRGLACFLFTLSSEACVVLVMLVVFERLGCVRVTCGVCCVLVLAAAASPLILLLFNTSCFLCATVSHLSRHRHDGDVTSLTSLLLANTALSASASLLRLLGPGVATPAALLFISALPSCLDPLIFIILGPRFTSEPLCFQGGVRGDRNDCDSPFPKSCK